MSRNVIFTENALSGLHSQIEYLQSVHALGAATRLIDRIDDFTSFHLALYPDTGRYIPERDIYEIWMPGTRLVLWYGFDDREVVIYAVWHTAQNRDETIS